jgi:hypothetical protein
MWCRYPNGYYSGPRNVYVNPTTVPNHSIAAAANVPLWASPPVRRDGATGALRYTGMTWHTACQHRAAIQAEQCRQLAQFKTWQAEIAERAVKEKQGNVAVVAAASRQVPLRSTNAVSAPTTSQQVQRAVSDVVPKDPIDSTITAAPRIPSWTGKKTVHWC